MAKFELEVGNSNVGDWTGEGTLRKEEQRSGQNPGSTNAVAMPNVSDILKGWNERCPR